MCRRWAQVYYKKETRHTPLTLGKLCYDTHPWQVLRILGSGGVAPVVCVRGGVCNKSISRRSISSFHPYPQFRDLLVKRIYIQPIRHSQLLILHLIAAQDTQITRLRMSNLQLQGNSLAASTFKPTTQLCISPHIIVRSPLKQIPQENAHAIIQITTSSSSNGDRDRSYLHHHLPPPHRRCRLSVCPRPDRHHVLYCLCCRSQRDPDLR